MKKIIVYIVILIILGCNHQPTLIELQRLGVTAVSMSEKRKIVNLVEKHYFSINRQDSILSHINEIVETTISEYDVNIRLEKMELLGNESIYETELKLHGIIKDFIILKAREDSVGWKNCLSLILQVAQQVDSKTNNHYWINFINQLKTFSKSQALAWLIAKEASIRCKQYHDKDQHWKIAEQYASIGLEMLQKINDKRIRLDIHHRIQFILDHFYGLPALSVTIAEINAQDAIKIGYHLRAAGMWFRMAWTLHTMGEIAKSYEINQKLINYTQKYQDVLFMDWYQRESSILLANEYWQLGKYQEGLDICHSIQNLDLTYDQIYRITNIEGLIYRALGQYEQAELKYNNALHFADSSGNIYNRVSILTNLGVLFDQLSEFKRSIDYFTTARNLLEASNPENQEYRADLTMNIINIYQKMGESDSVLILLKEARVIVENSGNVASRKVDLLMALGQIHNALGQIRESVELLEEAIQICDQNKMIHIGLQCNIKFIEGLIQLQEYSRAEIVLREILELSDRTNAIERMIDALAIQSEIQYQKGNLDEAIRISNKLIDKIHTLSQEFEAKNRLYAYRQKIYDYLKRSIIYEIAHDRIDLAYAKLTYAKQSSFLDIGYEISPNTHTSNAVVLQDLSGSKSELGLSANVLMMDYLLTDKTLYVFVVEPQGLRLLQRNIDYKDLQKNVVLFKKNILNTINSLNNYNKNKIEEHYWTSCRLGFILYEEIIGSFELDKLISEFQYLCVRPDEFLHEIPFASLVVDTLNSITYLAEKTTILTNTNFPINLQNRSASPDQNFHNKKVLISADTDIPGVGDLLKFLKSYFNNASELAISRDPSKKNVLIALDRDYDVYIIIGHAYANESYPEKSAIEFSVKNNSSSSLEKILLSMTELETISWIDVDMILLVGCETGSGRIYRNSGIFGLQQCLNALGARNVLGTLWKIDAGQAMDYVKDFVQHWVLTGNPALALRSTQLNALQNLNNHKFYRRPHPYFWSGYVLSYN